MGVGDPEHRPRHRAGPIRRLTRWYRRLNYESARRPRTVWTVRIDAALIVTGLLAVLIIFLLQSSVQRPATSRTIDFRVTVVNDTIKLEPVGNRKATGNDSLHVTLESARAGWPLTTAIVTTVPQVSWSLPSLADHVERTVQPRTPLTEQVELAPEILATLALSPDPKIRRFARGRSVHVDYIVFAIVTGVTWILLWLLSLPILGLVGVGEGVAGRVGRGRRQRRRKQNRCEHCGYDLNGLDFSAACPECGTLLK